MRYGSVCSGISESGEERLVLWFVVYIATVVAANWMISVVGLVPVGFGLVAPAGVYAAGLALTTRDLTQDSLGQRWVIVAIVAGAALSALLSPALALASGAAFLVSEVADFAVYTPLRQRRWLIAIVASNAVGALIDSALFLWLAFGTLDFLVGQLVGKGWATLGAVLFLGVWRTYGNHLSEWLRGARADARHG